MHPRIFPPELHNLTIERTTHRSSLHFAQTSSAWRVMLYVSRLKKAHAAADHPLQQALLTALFIHCPLLLKTECKSALRDGVNCLRQYRTAADILPESRLIALGLLLIIDPDNTKQHQREFLLTSICLVDAKPSLVNAVLTILAQNTNETNLSDSCIETSTQIKLVKSQADHYLLSVSEALLVLASLPADKKNNTYFPLVFQSFWQDNSINSLVFSHAALKLLPAHHAFWRKKQSIVNFIHSLPYTTFDATHTAAFTSLINTLNTFAKSDTDSSFLDDFLRDSTEIMGTSPLTNMIEQSVAVIQLTDEQSKVRWLENNLYHKLTGADHIWLKPICSMSQILLSQLESQEAVQSAFWHLYRFLLKAYPNRQAAATIMIKLLLPKIHEKSFWEKWTNTLYSDFQDEQNFNHDILDAVISTLSFIPSEKLANDFLMSFYTQEDLIDNKLYCKILPALFWQLSTPDLVRDWIDTLSMKIIPITLDRPRVYLECYAILLSHLSDDDEMHGKINALLPTLRTLFEPPRYKHNVYKAAEKLLHHLKDDKEIDLWFSLFENLNPKIFTGGLEANNRDLHIACVTALLQIASTDAKPRYENKFKEKFIDISRHCNDATISSALLSLTYKYKNAVVDNLVDMVLFAYRERSELYARPNRNSLGCYLEVFFRQGKGVEQRPQM